MNDDLSSKTALIWDSGLFVETAVVLARSFKRVLYFTNWKSAYPSSNRLYIGAGVTEPEDANLDHYLEFVGTEFDGIERVKNFFRHVDEADIIIFPDLMDGDLQEYLASKGKLVWGGRMSEELENYRWQTKDLLKRLNLPVQPVKRIFGLRNLREHLKTVENKWVKVPMLRGDWESWHHQNYTLSEQIIDEHEHKMGHRKQWEEYIVEDALEDCCEPGMDTFNIDGMWPAMAMMGYETKGAGLIGRWLPYDEFPAPILEVHDALSPILKKYGCRGFFSSEIRIGADQKPYLIDITARTPSPPGEMYPEMISNFAEVIWAGAQGEMVQPKVEFEYGCEICMECDRATDNWVSVYFPKEIRKFVKLRNCAKFDGTYACIPMKEGPRIGAVIGLGHTIQEAVAEAMKYAEMIEGNGLELDTASIAKGLKTIEEGEDLGVPFTDEQLPDAQELEDLRPA